MLSYEGWLEGSFTLGCLIFGFISGLFFFYQSKKTKAKILSHMGLLIIFMSLIYLGVSLDFLHILLTGDNINSTFQGIITYIWAAPATIVAMYIVAELLSPTKKKHVLAISLVLGVIFIFIIFLDPKGSLTSTNPRGEALIHTNVSNDHPLFIIIFIFIFIIGFGYICFGLLVKGIKSEGVAKKNFFLISSGFFLFYLLNIFDAFSNPGITLIFIRSGIFVSFLLWYLALKEKTVKHEEIPLKKEVSVEESLFRVTELKPGNITEDEVTFFREKKICLICKGKKLGFTYICPECEAFYCVKCAQALSDLENACWVCNLPVDKSKPSEPFKKEGEEVEIVSFKDSKDGKKR